MKRCMNTKSNIKCHSFYFSTNFIWVSSIFAWGIRSDLLDIRIFEVVHKFLHSRNPNPRCHLLHYPNSSPCSQRNSYYPCGLVNIGIVVQASNTTNFYKDTINRALCELSAERKDFFLLKYWILYLKRSCIWNVEYLHPIIVDILIRLSCNEIVGILWKMKRLSTVLMNLSMSNKPSDRFFGRCARGCQCMHFLVVWTKINLLTPNIWMKWRMA